MKTEKEIRKVLDMVLGNEYYTNPFPIYLRHRKSIIRVLKWVLEDG